MDFAALRDAARRGFKWGKPLQDPAKLFRLAVGMLVATIIGVALDNSTYQLLVTVGALIGVIIVVVPHNRSRIFVSLVTTCFAFVAAWAGLLLAGNWLVVFPVIFVMFLAAGLLSSVSSGISLRTILVTIVFLACAEMAPTISLSAGEALGYFAIGAGVMALAQFLPPYTSRYAAQRHAVGQLYQTIAAGRPISSALLNADRSLALLQRQNSPAFDSLMQLTERGEEIAQQLRALENQQDELTDAWRAAVQRQASAIAFKLSQPRPHKISLPSPTWPDAPRDELQQELVQSTEIATQLANQKVVSAASNDRHTPTSRELFIDELRWGSPVVHHAIRLAIVTVLAQAIGLKLSTWLGQDVLIPGHGFWTVIAATLIVFPDYGTTFSRGIGRSTGTIFGVIFGIGLSFLPTTSLTHALLLLLLFYGYLAFRSCGQVMTMFWIVAWVASLTPGPWGATTRGLDTIIGCVIAFATYLIGPTWQRRLLTERIKEWGEATAAHIDALVLLWSSDTEAHRLAVSHTAVRARIVSVEFLRSAQAARLEPRDRHNRWDNEALQPAITNVTQINHQLDALRILTPLWSTETRIRACSEVENSGRELSTITHPPTDTYLPDQNLAIDMGPQHASTNTTLVNLREAITNLKTLTAAQTRRSTATS